jgi:hypothetical protein
MADKVVSTVFFYMMQRQPASLPKCLPATSSRGGGGGVVALCVCVCVSAYLAILKLEDQLHLVALDLLLDDLGGDPAVGDVWLPCPGAVLVDVCHDGGRVPRTLVVLVGGVTVDSQGPTRGPAIKGLYKLQLAKSDAAGGGVERARSPQSQAQSQMHDQENCVRVEASGNAQAVSTIWTWTFGGHAS